MRIDRRNAARRVQFDPAIAATMMAIDGTWARKCLLIDVSDSGAQISVEGTEIATEEFFLMLSSIGIPAFRRCKRAWVEGRRIGVLFDKQRLPGRLLKRSSRNWESTPA
jgi:PilZ domain-containing protein